MDKKNIAPKGQEVLENEKAIKKIRQLNEICKKARERKENPAMGSDKERTEREIQDRRADSV